MGSSGGEPCTKGIDATVGGLVWVRRRNGSWWPGRIVGVDELPGSCLVSPRSGTPVKLLGRDDASLDWYNLEKSRRVKAFRCGEYNECIEKAKASAANSCKKAVKYARREDAILHALELESARLSKDNPESCSKMDKSGAERHLVKESRTISHSSKETEHINEESSSFEENSNSAPELSQSGVSFEEPNQVSASREQSVQGRRRQTPNDSEDDGMERVKRMRGLQDLGMGVVVTSMKRKRSHVAHVHEILKRKNRRRPLIKVLESTAMVSVPIMCEELPSPSGSPLPGVSDSKDESKSSFSMVLNNSDSTGVSCENGISLNASGHASDASLINYKQKESEISSMFGLPENDSSDRLFDVPFVGEENHPAGFAPFFLSVSQKPQVGAGVQSSQSSQVETVSLGNEELNESGSISSVAADTDSISQTIRKGSSKWQLKGKRNSRNTSKNNRQDARKSVNVDDESNAYLAGLESGDVFSTGFGWQFDRDPRAIAESQADEYQGWSGHVSHKFSHTRGSTADMKNLPDCSVTAQRSLSYHQSHYTVNPKYDTLDFRVRNFSTDSSLYDVKLEVKASYRPQHVPYISLRSKLYGQPIIGHPLTVDVLDDGFCDLLVSGPECHLTSSSHELDDDLEENISISAVQGVDMDYEMKPNPPGSRRVHQKHLSLHHVSPRKSHKARKNGGSSKKTRKLSSLTGSCRQPKDEMKPVVEKIKGPSVACVPLKLVFSRINASLNCSMRAPHHFMTSGNP